MTMLAELEGTGEKFSLDALMDVRARTRKAVHLIADQVKPGMAEEEAKALARDTSLNRESMYRMLSKSGNPSLNSLAAVLDACGLRLTVQSAPKRRRKKVA